MICDFFVFVLKNAKKGLESLLSKEPIVPVRVLRMMSTEHLLVGAAFGPPCTRGAPLVCNLSECASPTCKLDTRMTQWQSREPHILGVGWA